jgi:hypothetical protein
MENSECPLCHKKRLLTHHHLFSQSKVNAKLYGNLIHHPANIYLCCLDCHISKPIPKFTEEQFCAAVGIEPRSKTAQNKRLRQK